MRHSIILETPRFDGGIQFYGRFPNRNIVGRVENRYALSYHLFPHDNLAQTIEGDHAVV